MPGLEDLYREVILDHYRSPRNSGELETPPAHCSEGFNPLCGDEIIVYVETDGETITNIAIKGQGCSISQASASMMSSAVKGKSFDEIRDLTRAFKAIMSIHDDRQNDDEPAAEVRLGDLEALRGVVKFPVRIKCATLAWNTLAEAISAICAEAEPEPEPEPEEHRHQR